MSLRRISREGGGWLGGRTVGSGIGGEVLRALVGVDEDELGVGELVVEAVDHALEAGVVDCDRLVYPFVAVAAIGGAAVAGQLVGDAPDLPDADDGHLPSTQLIQGLHKGD